MDILYTDTDQVRGCLFLDAADLPDTLFNATLLERELSLDLDSWLPSHADLVGLVETASERAISNKIKSYATYWLAVYVSMTLSISLPQKISDGKNSRDLDQNHEGLRDTLVARLNALRSELILATGGTLPVALKLVTTVDLATDPVTSNGT